MTRPASVAVNGGWGWVRPAPGSPAFTGAHTRLAAGSCRNLPCGEHTSWRKAHPHETGALGSVKVTAAHRRAPGSGPTVYTTQDAVCSDYGCQGPPVNPGLQDPPPGIQVPTSWPCSAHAPCTSPWRFHALTFSFYASSQCLCKLITRELGVCQPTS